MTLLVCSIAIVLTVSALCSLTEAAVYAVRAPYIATLVHADSGAGRLLAGFKRNMEQPISAILIVNTAANTAGAAVAGAQARELFGESSMVWFSALFTVAVLLLAEILPKVAGVAYNRVVAPVVSRPLKIAIDVLYPVIWLTQRVSRLLQSDEQEPVAPEAEVQQLAAISAAEGSITKFESELVKNVLGLDTIKTGEIMTPRTVVFKLSASARVKEVADAVSDAPHARIPVYIEQDPDNWCGFVFRADALACMARDEFDRELSSLAKPLHFVPESLACHLLLSEFIKRRVHILGVADEYGVVQGIVTLEDVLETLLGREIVDETDREVDMREVARRRMQNRFPSSRQS